MEEQKKMDSSIKALIILFIIILILGVIFLVKINITKKNDKKHLEEILSNTDSTNADGTRIKENNKFEAKNTNKKDTSLITNMEDLFWKINLFLINNKYTIFIVVILCNIGMAMLYKKIEMPFWTVIYSIIYIFIYLMIYLVPTLKLLPFIANILSLVIGIIAYVKMDAFRLNFGKFKWILIAALILIGIITLITMKNLLSVVVVVGFSFVIILFFGFNIKFNINLASYFGKGVGYIIGLILLPTIFQPILGYFGKPEY